MKSKLFVALITVLVGCLMAVGAVADEITVWSAWPTYHPWTEAITALGEAFEAETGISVKVEHRSEDAVLVALAGGVVPDIVCFRGQLTSDFLETFAPLPHEALDEEDLLIASIMKPFAYKDGYYYNWPLPMFPSAIMFSNTRLLEQLGIPTHNLPEEIRELEPIIRKATTTDQAGNILTHGYGTWPSFSAGLGLADLISGNGGEWAIDGKAVFDSPEVLEVAEFYIGNARNGYFDLFNDGAGVIQDFAVGKVAFVAHTTSFPEELKAIAPDLPFGAQMEPYWSQPSYVLPPSWGFSIPVDAKNLEGAKEFMRFLNRPENHARLASLMSNVPFSEAAIRHEIYQQFIVNTGWMEPLVRAVPYTVSFADPNVTRYFFTDIRKNYTIPLLQKAVKGEISPSEFVYQMNHGIQLILDSLE